MAIDAFEAAHAARAAELVRDGVLPREALGAARGAPIERRGDAVSAAAARDGGRFGAASAASAVVVAMGAAIGATNLEHTSMLPAGNLERARLSQSRMNAFVLVVLVASAFDDGTRMKNIGEYARAAELFERHVREQPTDANAKGALRDAVVLRMGLGDDAGALADVEQYIRFYGNDAEAPTVAAAVVLHFADREDWTAVTREAARKMSLVDHGPIALRMQTHAALARAFAATRDSRATREYARVRDMSRELREPADGDALRRFAKGLDALGEALVFAADAQRDATAWAPLAANPGAATTEAWVAARSAQIRAVEAEYAKVTEIQPAPPPRWVIAGAARSAAMWARAADELVLRMPAKRRTDPHPAARRRSEALGEGVRRLLGEVPVHGRRRARVRRVAREDVPSRVSAARRARDRPAHARGQLRRRAAPLTLISVLRREHFRDVADGFAERNERHVGERHRRA